jgi:hypothetical protein
MPRGNPLSTGCHGFVRRHIVALERLHAGRLPAERIAREPYVRRLVRRGAVTPEQLNEAVAGCRAAPAGFAWITEVSPEVLAKADDVFLAEYGAFPVKNEDFQLNGTYHSICRGLQYNWHYYDGLLKRLQRDKDGHPYVRLEGDVTAVRETRTDERRVGSRWAFAVVLIAGLAGGPLAGAVISRRLSGEAASGLSVFVILWVLAVAGLLAVTRPRQVRQVTIAHRCSRCGRGLDAPQARIGCPACGASFAVPT